MAERDKVFTNCEIHTGGAVLRDHAVWISGGVILEVLHQAEIPKGADVTCLAGKILAPGYIDLQINGGGGRLFTNTPTAEALRVISKAHERFGVLNLCPAVISADTGTILQSVKAVKEAAGMNIGILGLHIEGPFIGQAKSGIHDTKKIRAADADEIDRLLRNADGVIKIMTVAPEAIGGRLIERLTASGVRVFIGHTNAACGQVLEAFRHGAAGVTHLYNAMSQLTGREPGTVGASFLEGDTWAGIIADGVHVDYDAIRIAKKMKGRKLFLVTDAMPPVGGPDAAYTIGDEVITCAGGRCAASDGTLAGAALDMAAAVRNVVGHCGIPADEAIRMATVYPAEALGMEGLLGSIRPGGAADMIVLDKGLCVEAVIRRGEYKKTAG